MLSWRSVENLIKFIIGNRFPAFNFSPSLGSHSEEKKNSLERFFIFEKAIAHCQQQNTQSIHNGSTRVQKSAFWFEKKGKQIATRPMNLCHVLVSQKRVIKGVAYELIGSFSLRKKEKSIASTVFFVLSVINLWSRMEKNESLLVIAYRFGTADKSNERTLHNEIKALSISLFAQCEFGHKEIQLLYHFPRIFSFLRR